MQEIWKDIHGFEGVYQISNKGNVRSFNRKCPQILAARPNSRGYLRVELKTNGKCEQWFVHRLVALHFVENPCPDKYTIVNHLDCNYLNNNAENLEWTTLSGNSQHAVKHGRMDRTKDWLQHLRETNEKNGKSIIATHIETGEMLFFKCLNDCAQKGFQPSCVCQCCKGMRKTHKHYQWHYAETSKEIVKGE